MEDIKSPSSVTIGELTRIVKEFEEKIQNGTEDSERFSDYLHNRRTLDPANWRYQYFIFGYVADDYPKY